MKTIYFVVLSKLKYFLGLFCSYIWQFEHILLYLLYTVCLNTSSSNLLGSCPNRIAANHLSVSRYNLYNVIFTVSKYT